MSTIGFLLLTFTLVFALCTCIILGIGLYLLKDTNHSTIKTQRGKALYLIKEFLRH